MTRINKDPLNHSLNAHFRELAGFSSSSEMEKSEIYRLLKPEIERVLESIELGIPSSKPSPPGHKFIRATAWNIERGNAFEGLLNILSSHPDIKNSDVFLITELDHGMIRSENRHVARELSDALNLNSVFATSYINLEKGSGLEIKAEGENQESLHGNALFSPHPVEHPFIVRLVNGKDKMKGKEKRLGSQAAVGATIQHPSGPFRAVSIHLDPHASQGHRADQMEMILDHIERMSPQIPVLLGGDWNTTTYNAKNAFSSIMSYCKQILMGARNVIQNHFPNPDIYFEKKLFQLLERREYNYRELNVPGGCTLHYSVEDIAANGGLADWVPFWCFWFINWTLAGRGGQCSVKLDWFAGKNIAPHNSRSCRIANEVHDRKNPLSDHDPIILDFQLKQDS